MKKIFNINNLLTAILVGLTVAAATFAFIGPSASPPNGNPYFWLLSSSNLYYTGGNVGIGTASPGHRLESYISSETPGTDSTYPFFANVGGYGVILGYNSTVGYAEIAGVQSGIAWKGLLINPYGGNVGIGSAAAPAYTLDVNGTFHASGNWSLPGAAQSSLNLNNYNISGVNKLSVTTIDPVYNIGGVKYATYGPESIGIAVTSDGKGALNKISDTQYSKPDYQYVIDFGNAIKGSDLWLFWQTINEGQGMKNITLTLTPEGGFAELWYDLIPAAKEIIVHGDRLAAFSYHLSAPRFDSNKWGNTLMESGEPGVPLVEK